MTLTAVNMMPFAVFAAATLWLSWCDLRRRIIPSTALLTFLAIFLVEIALAAVDQESPWRFVEAIACGAAFFLASLLMALWRPQALGGGDVKLAALIGVALGWLGWIVALVGVALILVMIAVITTVSSARSLWRVKRVTLPLAPVAFFASWVTIVGVAALSEPSHISGVIEWKHHISTISKQEKV